MVKERLCCLIRPLRRMKLLLPLFVLIVMCGYSLPSGLLNATQTRYLLGIKHH